MAHLSYDRLAVTKEEKPWKVELIVDGVATVLHRFIDLVPSDRVQVGFCKRVRELLAKAEAALSSPAVASTSGVRVASSSLADPSAID